MRKVVCLPIMQNVVMYFSGSKRSCAVESDSLVNNCVLITKELYSGISFF